MPCPSWREPNSFSFCSRSRKTPVTLLTFYKGEAKVDKDEAIRLLKADLAQFNKWKRENPQERLDLSGADLRGANLKGAQLRQVNLSGADLRDADLTDTALADADLTGANLEGATLIGANLHRIVWRDVNLRNAKVGGFAGEGRLCMTEASFDEVPWEREQLEEMLRIMNLNQNWEIQYQLVPKKGRA